MNCQKCGNEIPDGARVCSRCSPENRSALTPAARIQSGQLPSLLSSKLTTLQRNGLAFGIRDMTVKSAVVQSFNLGSSSSGKVKIVGMGRGIGRWSVFGGLGTITQQTTNSYRTDIQIKLVDNTGLNAFLNYSLPFAITLAVEPGESLRIFFVKGGLPRPIADGDFRCDDWTPFAAESLDTRQLLPIMGVPTLAAPDEALLIVAIGSGIVTLASLKGGTLGVVFLLSLVSVILIGACLMRERSYRFGLKFAAQKATEELERKP